MCLSIIRPNLCCVAALWSLCFSCVDVHKTSVWAGVRRLRESVVHGQRDRGRRPHVGGGSGRGGRMGWETSAGRSPGPPRAPPPTRGRDGRRRRRRQKARPKRKGKHLGEGEAQRERERECGGGRRPCGFISRARVECTAVVPRLVVGCAGPGRTDSRVGWRGGAAVDAAGPLRRCGSASLKDRQLRTATRAKQERSDRNERIPATHKRATLTRNNFYYLCWQCTMHKAQRPGASN